MIALELARVRPQSLEGVISIEGWSNHHAQRDAFQGDTMSTLSDGQLAERERLRQDVLRRWTRRQQTAFAAIWRTWDGYDLLQRTDLPILELYGDRGVSQRRMSNCTFRGATTSSSAGWPGFPLTSPRAPARSGAIDHRLHTPTLAGQRRLRAQRHTSCFAGGLRNPNRSPLCGSRDGKPGARFAQARR